jgi:nucleotide-binding universal stress UspA family protein
VTIVCGVDGSNAAADAASTAALLADALGHRLVLVHAVEPTATVGYAINPYGFQSQRAQEEEGQLRYDAVKEAGERLLESVGRALDLGLSSAQRVDVGEPSLVLADIAEEERAELVVVGTRARGKLASAILGSVSSELISRAPCPVLVVPPGTQVKSGTIVCAVDDSSAARHAARAARSLSQSLGGELVLAHAIPTTLPSGTSAAATGPDRWAIDEHHLAEEFLARLVVEEGLNGDVERRVVFGSQADAIRALAAELNAALIVVGTRRRGALRSALAGSVSLDLKGTASRPVLIVPTGVRIPLRT